MKFFITGASGFIGKSFLKNLLKKAGSKDQIYLLLRREVIFNDKRVKTLIGSLDEIGKYKKYLLKSDYVFHIAAIATFGDDFDYMSINFEPTKKIANILKKSRNLKNFIFISTMGAYDRHKKDKCIKPISNYCVPNPTSEYGKSKLKAENYIKRSNIPHTIIRPTFVYGKGMRANSHINLFVSMAYEKSIVLLFNFPGKVSLIHVDDLSKSLVNCINNQKIINKSYFAATESMSLGRILRIIYHKIYKKDLFQLFVPSLRPIIGRLHRRIPLTLANLFVDYLYVKDKEFIRDLIMKKPIDFKKGVDDVIRTNVRNTGYWIISGANSGIGLALASKLRKKGIRLILIDRNIDIIKSFKDNKNIIIKADLSNYKSIEKISQVINEYQIYCLINNAGIGVRSSFENISIEQIKAMIDVNIGGYIYLTKLLLNNMVRNQSKIVNIASSIAYNPLPNMLMYSATKAFISNWSESLTYELRKTNKVITFSPSGTNTNFQKASGVKHDEKGKGLLTVDYVADQILKAIRKNKTFVLLGLSTKILLFVSKFLPKKINIIFWGILFDKLR